MSKSNFSINKKKINDLCKIKELQNKNLEKDDKNVKLLLRKTKRPDYSNNFTDAMKEKTLIGLNNGRWNNLEHRTFIEGIFKYSNDWKKIIDGIKTRNCPQARSHSQKFFSKLYKYITKSNSNYYVDLKKIFILGKEIQEEKLKNITDTLVLAHDHLDNVLKCEILNHNLIDEFLEVAKRLKIPKENQTQNSIKDTTKCNSGKVKSNDSENEDNEIEEDNNQEMNNNLTKSDVENSMQFNNINLTTIRDNSSIEDEENKNINVRENNNNDVNLNFELLEFAKNISQEIEKEKLFLIKNDREIIKKNFNLEKNNYSIQNEKKESIEKKQTEKDITENKIYDNSLGKLSSYDYNNFYFNRCLEYLKKTSCKGKTDLIQEIKKCFIFPKKLLIENNNCNCLQCRNENAEKSEDYFIDDHDDTKPCINNKFYYCEFDDISFISNHEKVCNSSLKKESELDSQNID